VWVDGIGELTNRGAYWRLTYGVCGHVQLFARRGLGDPQRVARYARRHYGQCLICRLPRRPPRLGIRPPQADVLDHTKGKRMTTRSAEIVRYESELVISADALDRFVGVLRQVADGLAEILSECGGGR
jgi:hypothetical protein